jgi:ubiquinone/menaquinone biosynthesis C-methylase UbiE
MLIDKKKFLDNQSLFGEIEVELGCGSRKRHSQAIGIDLIDTPDVDIVGDVFDVLSRFRGNSVKAIYAYHFLEHVVDIEKLLREFERILIKGGEVLLVVPHFSSPYFYSDPTHKAFFGLYTLCYFTERHPFVRKVPTYGNSLAFEIITVDLGFKAERPFYIRYVLRRMIGLVFNATVALKELYEDMFSNIFSCYELRYQLRKI